MPNHLKQLFKRLKKGSLTKLQWYKLTNSMCLERRIYDLRKLVEVKRKMIKVNEKMIARYSL